MNIKKLAVAGLIAGAVLSGGTAQAAISDDDPNFNCLTQGNKVCGPAFGPLPSSYVGWMSKEYKIPRSTLKHSLIEWVRPSVSSEEVMHIVTPGYKNHRLGRVFYF